MTRNLHYALDLDRKVIPVSLEEWATFLGRRERVVEQTDTDTCWVSTVFLGLDHNYSRSGPPLLFETMVFSRGNPGDDEEMYRYPTWDEAQAGHTATVDRIRGLEAEAAQSLKVLKEKRK